LRKSEIVSKVIWLPSKLALQIKTILQERTEEIESLNLTLWIADECHLLWGDTVGYVWGL
jgi:hypothetical protein